MRLSLTPSIITYSKVICRLLRFFAYPQQASSNSRIGCKPEPDKESINDAAGYNLQLGVTYMRQGQMAVALEKLAKSVAQDPDRADTHTALAVLYTRLGRLEEADAEYRHSLRLEPSNSSTLNNYGAFLCQRGAYGKAMASFAKAVKDPLYRTPAAAHTNAGVCARLP